MKYSSDKEGRGRKLPPSVSSFDWRLEDNTWCCKLTDKLTCFVKVKHRLWMFRKFYFVGFLQMSASGHLSDYLITTFRNQSEQQLETLLAIARLTEEVPDGGHTSRY